MTYQEFLNRYLENYAEWIDEAQDFECGCCPLQRKCLHYMESHPDDCCAEFLAEFLED